MKYLILLLFVASAFAQDSTAYRRSEWKHWIDADSDCQDTRQEVLIDESVIPVTFDERGCKVISGRWICPYTGMVFTDPSQLDVDHMVALNSAHEAGGWRWDRERKMMYANELNQPIHLVAVYKGANRSKGSKKPNEWLPPNKYYRCLYVLDWVNIKMQWELTMTPDESEFIINYLETNCKETN